MQKTIYPYFVRNRTWTKKKSLILSNVMDASMNNDDNHVLIKITDGSLTSAIYSVNSFYIIHQNITCFTKRCGVFQSLWLTANLIQLDIM